MSRWDTLSNELKLAIQIFRITDAGNKCNFMTLSNSSELNKMKHDEIRDALNHLIDMGTVKVDYIKTEFDTNWTRTFTISNESESFIRRLSQELK